MGELLRSTAIVLVLSVGAAGVAGAASSPGQGSQSGAAAGQSSAGCPSPAAIDSNNDGFVTDKEADDHSAKIFNALDGDSDGTVSKFEYMECQTNVTGLYRVSGRDTGWDKRTEDSYAQMDSDKDDSVSAEEYMKQAQEKYDSQSKSGKVKSEDYSRNMEGMSSGSQSADTNQDGNISQDEAAADAARSFQELDSDGNGKLARDEWTGSEQMKQADAAFSEIDKDGNGKLSKEEFREAAKANFEQSAQAGEPVSIWIFRTYEAM